MSVSVTPSFPMFIIKQGSKHFTFIKLFNPPNMHMWKNNPVLWVKNLRSREGEP